MFLLVAALCGCAGDVPDVDTTAIDALDPLPGRATAVDCAELFEPDAEAEGLPQRCWTYEETDGLAESFAALAADVETLTGTEPLVDPFCMPTSEGSRVLLCTGAWTLGDRVVLLGSGVTLHWLEDAVEAQDDWRDPSLPALHEIVLSVVDDLPDGYGDALRGTTG